MNTSGTLDNNNAYNSNGCVPDYESARFQYPLLEGNAVQSHAGRIIPVRSDAENFSGDAVDGVSTASTPLSYYDDAISFGALYKALKKCCRNVRWKDSVVGFEANGLKNIYNLRQDLLRSRYKLLPYQIFEITEPKKRTIVATKLRDRVVQRALCDNGLYQDLTSNFILDSYACQIGKGSALMDRRVKEMLHWHYMHYGTEGWILKCDIHHFFPSTRHSVAKDAVGRRVGDQRVKDIVFKVIDSFEGDAGIGLGSQLSQLMELAVLDDLDHFVKDTLHIKCYGRYMDDFFLIYKDKTYLRTCLKRIASMMEEVGLELNRKTTIYPLRQGLKFCQWRYFLTETGKVVQKLNPKKMKKARHKLKKLMMMESQGKIPKGRADASLQSFLANAERGDTYRQRRQIAGYIEELRCSISKKET